MNTIKHIGLQVSEVDVKPFYEEIFKFKYTSSFVLTIENATNIFGISAAVSVLAGNCPEMDLELFIHEKPVFSTFNHICFETKRMNEIAEKAAVKGYKIYVREGSETLFLVDSCQNLFEIKQLSE